MKEALLKANHRNANHIKKNWSTCGSIKIETLLMTGKFMIAYATLVKYFLKTEKAYLIFLKPRVFSFQVCKVLHDMNVINFLEQSELQCVCYSNCLT